MAVRFSTASPTAPAREPTVASGFVRGLVRFAVARGANEKQLLAAAGIDASSLDDRDGRQPLARYSALMRTAKELTGDAALALHFGEAVELAEISILGTLGGAATTLDEGLAQLNRYAPLAIDLPGAEGERFRIQHLDGRLWLIDARPNPDDFVELTESTFARIVCSLRRVAGDQVFITAVHLTHAAPRYREEYDRIFRAPVIFGSSRNALVIDGRLLMLPTSKQAGYASDVMKDHAEALLERLEKSKSMTGRVEALLLPMLQSGEASIAKVAARLGLSRQSLFRKLKAEGVTFEHVLDDLRCRMARHYLQAEKMSVSEAAYRLGFSDPGAFTRAFKRWTGVSPRTLLRREGVTGSG